MALAYIRSYVMIFDGSSTFRSVSIAHGAHRTTDYQFGQPGEVCFTIDREGEDGACVPFPHDILQHHIEGWSINPVRGITTPIPPAGSCRLFVAEEDGLDPVRCQDADYFMDVRLVGQREPSGILSTARHTVGTPVPVGLDSHASPRQAIRGPLSRLSGTVLSLLEPSETIAFERHYTERVPVGYIREVETVRHPDAVQRLTTQTPEAAESIQEFFTERRRDYLNRTARVYYNLLY
jgi:hypothetical protein